MRSRTAYPMSRTSATSRPGKTAQTEKRTSYFLRQGGANTGRAAGTASKLISERGEHLQLPEMTMSSAIAEIEAKVRTLNRKDKAELIRVLIAELDGPADADVERTWFEEAKRRHREIIEGKVKPAPAERVFENLRARLKR